LHGNEDAYAERAWAGDWMRGGSGLLDGKAASRPQMHDRK
jgi:hypothetical protein